MQSIDVDLETAKLTLVSMGLALWHSSKVLGPWLLTWEIWNKLLGPGFDLGQSWPLQLRSEPADQTSLSLSIPLPL